MARLRGHKALDYSQPLYVKAASLKWDRTYKRGELFPWQALKALPRKVHQLWMQKLIGHERLGDAFQGAEDPAPFIAPPTAVDVMTPAELETATQPSPPHGSKLAPPSKPVTRPKR